MSLERESNIFNRALEIADAIERQNYVVRACGNDPALAVRIQALLQGHARAHEVWSTGAGESTETVSNTESSGATIGNYKLLERIGEGGFGEVFAAEQRGPVSRRVAVKVIKSGMDSKTIVARFEAERQALAMMNHPSIAKIFDGGCTPEGRPYFVMELVKGIPISMFCDQERLDIESRLRLFNCVCQAIQHAHQNGIIHRDIKPGNILVTLRDGEPVPKVIDFGIAKATQMELTEKTVYTKLNKLLGTPAYMSPEQAEMSGLNIDTRSDIYSLGVLLYELVTGRQPFETKDLVKAGLDGMRRMIREVEPVRPSTKIETLEEQELTQMTFRRRSHPRQFLSVIRGDLDWVIMKALEKSRTRRYDSVHAFELDIENFLAQRPVAARPPSVGYRIARYIERAAVLTVTRSILGTAGIVLTITFLLSTIILETIPINALGAVCSATLLLASRRIGLASTKAAVICLCITSAFLMAMIAIAAGALPFFGGGLISQPMPLKMYAHCYVVLFLLLATISLIAVVGSVVVDRFRMQLV